MSEVLKKVEKDSFRIGAVASMTGIPTVTIRMWERRYGAVAPKRSDKGIRLYSQNDVQRLRMIRACIANGDAVSQVATLDTEDLVERLEGVPPASRIASRPLKVALVGHWLMSTLQGSGDGVDVAVREAEIDDLSTEITDLDLAILEMDYLSHTNRDDLERLSDFFPAARFLIIYRVGSERTAWAFESRGVHTARGPMSEQQLIRSIQALCVVTSEDSGVPDRLVRVLQQPIPDFLFTPTELATYSQRSATVQCECPRHVTELVASLKAFEDYSAHCENRNPGDAHLHTALHSITAEARRLMEEALQHLIEAEGLDE